MIEVLANNSDRKVGTLDGEADKRLNHEIDKLLGLGYDIKIHPSSDPAYSHPEIIERVYSDLSSREDDIESRMPPASLVSAMAQCALANLGIRRITTRRQSIAEDKLLEPMRRELLYGPGQKDAEAWHSQRGSALALLTITSAANLKSPSNPEGGHQTMSGPLDAKMLDFVFPETVEHIGGMSIEEAVGWSRYEYGGKSNEEAKKKAKAKMFNLAEFLKAEVTDEFKEVIEYCYDSLGIRDREEVVRCLMGEYIDERLGRGEDLSKEELFGASFGCGTALPAMKAMKHIKDNYGVELKWILIDQDPIALAAAIKLAEGLGMQDQIEVHCERLFSKFGQPMDLSSVLNGRKLTLAEDSGLREYLDDGTYRKLTRELWRNIEPGGLMITGNMNENRPHASFLHGLMGWLPRVKMRKIGDMLKLHEQSGIEKGSTRVIVTHSGVYSNLASSK